MNIQLIKEFIEKENLLFKYPASGIGISTKQKRGKETNEMCIVFYVDEKKHLSLLRNDEIIPSEFDIKGEKVKTDIRVKTNYDLNNFTLPTDADIQKINKVKDQEKFYDEDGNLIIDLNPLGMSKELLATLPNFTTMIAEPFDEYSDFVQKTLSGERYLYDDDYRHNYDISNDFLSYNPVNYINDPNNLLFTEQLTASDLFRNRVKARPLSGGVSSIFWAGSDATLAGIVLDSTDRTPVAISNNHVYGGNSNVGASNLYGVSTVTNNSLLGNRFSNNLYMNFVGLSARQPATSRFQLAQNGLDTYDGPLSGINTLSNTASSEDIIGYMKRASVLDHHVFNDGIVNKNMLDTAILELSGYDLIDSTSVSQVNLRQEGPYDFCSTDELDSLMDPSSPNYRAPMFRSGRSLGAVGYPGSVTTNSGIKQMVYPKHSSNLIKLDKKFDKFYMSNSLTTSRGILLVRWLNQPGIGAFDNYGESYVRAISSNENASVSGYWRFGKGSSFLGLSSRLTYNYGGLDLLPHGDTTDFQYDGEFKHLCVKGSFAIGLSSNNKFVWRGISPFDLVALPWQINLKSTNRDKTPWAFNSKPGDENYKIARGMVPLSARISNGDGQYFNDYYWSETFFNSPSTVGEWCKTFDTTQSELTSRIGPIPEEDLNDVKKIEIASGIYNTGIYVLTHSGKLYVCGVQDNARSLGLPVEEFPQSNVPKNLYNTGDYPLSAFQSLAYAPMYRYLNETYIQKEIDLLGSDYITDSNTITGDRIAGQYSAYSFQELLSGECTRFDYTPLTGYATLGHSQPGGRIPAKGGNIASSSKGTQTIFPWYQIGGTYDDIITTSNAESPEFTNYRAGTRSVSHLGYSIMTVFALSGNKLHYTVPWVADKGGFGSTVNTNLYQFPEGSQRYNLSANCLDNWGSFKKIEMGSILSDYNGYNYGKGLYTGSSSYYKRGIHFFGLSSNDQWVFCSKGHQDQVERGDLINFEDKPYIEELPFYGENVTFNKNGYFPQVLSGGKTGSRYNNTGVFGKKAFVYGAADRPVTNIQYALSGSKLYFRTFGKVDDYSLYDTDLMHPISSYLATNGDTTNGEFVTVPGLDNITEIYGTFCDDLVSYYNNILPTHHARGLATKFVIQSAGEWYFTGDNTCNNFPLTSKEYPYMEVIDINSTVSVGGSRIGTGRAIFDDVFAMRAKYDNFPVAMGGDSGSMVMALLSANIPSLSTWKVAGQLFAGNIVMNGNNAICNRIDRMQEQLKIEPWDGVVPDSTHKSQTEFATVSSSEYAIYSVELSGRTYYNVGLSGQLVPKPGAFKNSFLVRGNYDPWRS